MKVERPHIAVFGAGRTGREIALAFAHGGYDVRIIDGETRRPDEFTRFADEVRAALRTALATFAVNAVDRIDARVHVVPATDIADVLARADVVFEAVADTLEAKRIALARIGADAVRRAGVGVDASLKAFAAGFALATAPAAAPITLPASSAARAKSANTARFAASRPDVTSTSASTRPSPIAIFSVIE